MILYEASRNDQADKQIECLTRKWRKLGISTSQQFNTRMWSKRSERWNHGLVIFLSCLEKQIANREKNERKGSAVRKEKGLQ